MDLGTNLGWVFMLYSGLNGRCFHIWPASKQSIIHIVHCGGCLLQITSNRLLDQEKWTLAILGGIAGRAYPTGLNLNFFMQNHRFMVLKYD